MSQVTKHLKIAGRVQGVGFRYTFYYVARDAGVTGWVKNCSDGTVEAVVQGTPAQVDAVVEWAGKGPSMSRVDSIQVSDGFGEYAAFEIQPH